MQNIFGGNESTPVKGTEAGLAEEREEVEEVSKEVK
jgi:hypothetical protein